MSSEREAPTAIPPERATGATPGERDFRHLAEAMPQLVWITGPDGYHEYFNQQWFDYTGTTLQSAAGEGWMRALHPDDRARTTERWERSLRTGEPYEIEYRFRRARDGAYRWFLGRATAVRGAAGEIVRWFGTCTDIDDQKRAAAHLERAERELRESEERLRAADRRKDEFLGVLSHELRNPLAPIRNSIFILERAEPGSEPARRAFAVIARQTDHLTRLVDDLLDVTRIARGKIELRRERLDVADVVRRAAEDHRSTLAVREVALRVEVPAAPVLVDADATRIAQLVGNLLHNAAKFTPHGGAVTVTVAAEAGCASICVRDTGIGIDADLLPRVFEPFVQAEHSLARTQGGLGLGLALVKGIAELHGGSVCARSAGPGRGAEFVVTLPGAGARPEAGPSSAAATHAPPGARRVLVVDDNADAADSLAELVRALGHDAEVAYDGEGAVARATASRYDVVLCDIGLPVMSGYDVARKLRADGARVGRLVAVSGYAQPDDVARAIEAGFDVHVAKPPAIERIAALLEERA